MSRRAVFLDRDGVLNPDVGYPHSIEDAKVFEDVLPGLLQLVELGLLLIVVSNQSGVARGLFSSEDVRKFNASLIRRLLEGGVDLKLNQFYFCPHRPEDRCSCRKPAPGLIFEAATDFDIDLAKSFLIGDRETDVSAGRAAGLVTILLNRSHTLTSSSADFRASSLISAANIIRAEL